MTKWATPNVVSRAYNKYQQDVVRIVTTERNSWEDKISLISIICSINDKTKLLNKHWLAKTMT